MAKLKTTVWLHNAHSRFPCDLCGNWHEQPGAAVILSEVSSSNPEDRLGEVCPECVRAGPEGAAKRIESQAQALRQEADRLEALAPRVASIEDWTSWEEFCARTAERDDKLEALHQAI